MSDPYQLLAAALAGGQLVLSGQVGPIWPNRGNSFWVTHADGLWHLFTWVPIGYRVPDSADMAALCRMCMGYGDIAMGAAPPAIVEAFGLVELSEAEVETVYRQMDASD